MGSCVSKKAARAGAAAKSKVAAPLPVTEKETTRALPPVAEAVDEEQEEEVKEVVLSEAPAPPPRPPLPEPVKPRQQPEADDEEEESAPSEACSASDGSASVESAAKAKLMHKMAGAEPEAEKKAAAAGAPRKGRKTPAAAPQEEKEGAKSRGSGAAAGNARARSPSPSSAHNRRQHHPPPAARPRREQPAVVSGIGCRSGRFSPSAARRAAESAAAVRRTHSAREADMALPSTKRSLAAAINGLSRRGDAGERSGRRSDSPTGRRAPASPSVTHRPGTASPVRKAAKEHGTHERGRTRGRDGEEQPAVGGGERKKVEESALGQNPSVAMECFIFL